MSNSRQIKISEDNKKILEIQITEIFKEDHPQCGHPTMNDLITYLIQHRTGLFYHKILREVAHDKRKRA